AVPAGPAGAPQGAGREVRGQVRAAGGGGGARGGGGGRLPPERRPLRAQTRPPPVRGPRDGRAGHRRRHRSWRLRRPQRGGGAQPSPEGANGGWRGRSRRPCPPRPQPRPLTGGAMLTAIIRLSLRHRPLVVAASLALLLYGGYLAAQLPIDVFPDLDRP